MRAAAVVAGGSRGVLPVLPRAGQNPRVNWKTVRAAYVRKLTESYMATFAAQVEVEELPRSVLKTRGWEDAVIDQFEIGCVEYTRGTYVPLTPMTCVQLHGAVTHEGKIWLLAEELSLRCSHVELLTVWRRREPRTWHLRPLSGVRGCRPHDLVREGKNSLWFL